MSTLRTFVAFLFLVATWCPTTARAQTDGSVVPRFGSPGQIVLGGATNVGLSYTTYDASAASQFGFTFSPNLDYFVFRNFSVGVDMYAGYSDDIGYGSDSSVVETKTTTVNVGPRFGWNIPLGDSFSWWPTATLGIETTHTNESLPSGGTLSTPSAGGASTGKDGLYVGAYAPLLFHPVPHFFLGVGPSFSHDFATIQGAGSAGQQATTFGASFLVGGYFGGAHDTTNADVPPSPDASDYSSPPKRFGDRAAVVFGSDLGLGLSQTSYAGTSSGIGSGSIDAAVDYFFVKHVSIGGGFYASFYNSTSTDGAGNTVTSNDTAYGVFFRVGVQIPLAGPVSLYPRASIGGGSGYQGETSSSGQDAYSLLQFWGAAYVPLVVEVAPHFIAGFGPSISRDIANTATFPSGQQYANPGTTLGAGFLVGGWL